MGGYGNSLEVLDGDGYREVFVRGKRGESVLKPDILWFVFRGGGAACRGLEFDRQASP